MCIPDMSDKRRLIAEPHYSRRKKTHFEFAVFLFIGREGALFVWQLVTEPCALSVWRL